MKRIQIDRKDYILITPKQLEKMLRWFEMASNCGDNDLTKSDSVIWNDCQDILDTIKEETKYGVIYTHFKK